MAIRFTWLAAGTKTRQVTLGELGALLWKHGRTGGTGQPSPWDRLVSELRQAGYLSPDDDLAELLGSYLVADARRRVHLPAAAPMSPSAEKLGQPLPGELVSRLWRMAPERRYWAQGGFLTATTSTSAPLLSAQALERYGIKLLIPDRPQ